MLKACQMPYTLMKTNILSFFRHYWGKSSKKHQNKWDCKGYLLTFAVRKK